MQFSIIAMLGLSALAVAAPAPVAEPAALAEVEGAIIPRGDSYKFCCKKGSNSKCSSCDPQQSCPEDKPDSYSSCSENTQLGLVNVFVCNVLNNNQLNIPVTLNVLS